MNRTLLDRVRCMLIDSNLSRVFRAEALTTTVRIVNFIPCKATKEKSPEWLWSDREPDYSTLKVFGCTAFAHVPNQKRNKLDDKGIECIFVGYSDTSKAYRLLNKVNKTIVLSRDVNFIENDFSYGCNDENDDDFFIVLPESCQSGGDIVECDSHISEGEDEIVQYKIAELSNAHVAENDYEIVVDDSFANPNITIVDTLDDTGASLDETSVSTLDDTHVSNSRNIQQQ